VAETVGFSALRKGAELMPQIIYAPTLRGAQIPFARSPGLLDFVQWRTMYVGP
jgi:hypothetical protein